MVIDRYYYSGIVYSAAKGRPDLSLEWARRPEVGLPRPDICFFLDITTEAAAKRVGFGDEKYETSAMQKRVRELFYELVKLPDGQDIRVIDAGRNIEAVETDIAERARELMGHSKMTEAVRSILPWADMPEVAG